MTFLTNEYKALVLKNKGETPLPQQWQIVINKLKRIETRANKPGRLDLSEAIVYERDHHPCGSVACVAGWYLIASFPRGHIPAPIWRNKSARVITYSEGANLMAKDLGFDGKKALQKWADKHPDIWGNTDGYDLFHTEDAYNGLPEAEHSPMSVIIAHFGAILDAVS